MLLYCLVDFSFDISLYLCLLSVFTNFNVNVQYCNCETQLRKVFYCMKVPNFPTTTTQGDAATTKTL